ncbi:hypothetical protein DOTSEDRAFT_73532 [Dothistroma septosporum NZE10]|uniref:Uncharacterized protein n=1 Tax=Dothistroma septosporum (strain NZE10 / CBS 128990) TaxID=675120 RepID=N1PK50_DOTSN|nr:hypothetical protein DOTSEDRAFT_73532 [Dothistroma septosporum NZE10]
MLSAIAENSQAGRLLERRRPRNLGRDIRWNRLPENTNEHVFVMLEEAGGVFGFVDRILEGYLESSCSEPRDKIFALVGDPVMRALDPAMRLVPDYALLLEELALVFIAYCDGIHASWSQILPGLAGSHTPSKDLPEVLLSLHRALGTERDPRKFLEALDGCVVRTEDSTESSTMVLLCGARIGCSGPLMGALLDLPTSRYSTRSRASISGDHGVASTVDGTMRRMSCLCPDCPYC